MVLRSQDRWGWLEGSPQFSELNSCVQWDERGGEGNRSGVWVVCEQAVVSRMCSSLNKRPYSSLEVPTKILRSVLLQLTTGSVKKFIQVFPCYLPDKPKTPYWPSQYNVKKNYSSLIICMRGIILIPTNFSSLNQFRSVPLKTLFAPKMTITLTPELPSEPSQPRGLLCGQKCLQGIPSLCLYFILVSVTTLQCLRLSQVMTATPK